MAFTKTLQRYDAFLSPNQGKQHGRINLSFDDHKLYLFFMDPADPLPVNSYNATEKIGVAYQRFSQYPHYLDLVRNEKPISVVFRPETTPPTFVVYCAGEVPGEGEM
jgi:hypothetical protein